MHNNNWCDPGSNVVIIHSWAVKQPFVDPFLHFSYFFQFFLFFKQKVNKKFQPFKKRQQDSWICNSLILSTPSWTCGSNLWPFIDLKMYQELLDTMNLHSKKSVMIRTLTISKENDREKNQEIRKIFKL